jgi:hypothetical protein
LIDLAASSLMDGEGSTTSWVEAVATGSRFVSEKQLEEERQQLGGPPRAPVPDGPRKPLWEQLQSNRDRAEEDFKEKIRFRMPPPTSPNSHLPLSIPIHAKMQI